MSATNPFDLYSEETGYDREQAGVFDAGRFFLFDCDILKILKSGDETIYFSLLLSKSAYWFKENDYRHPWFYCKLTDVTALLGFPQTKQSILMKRLKKKSLVVTQLVGNPAVRYIRIRYKVLREMLNRNSSVVGSDYPRSTGSDYPLDKTDTEKTIPPSLRSATRNSDSGAGVGKNGHPTKNEKDGIPSPTPKGAGPIEKKKNKDGIPPQNPAGFPFIPNKTESQLLAKEMELALRKKNLMSPTATPKKWPDVIRRNLAKMGGEKSKFVIKVMKWHISTIGEPYMVEAHSAASFFERFEDVFKSYRKHTGDTGAETLKVKQSFVDDDGED